MKKRTGKKSFTHTPRSETEEHPQRELETSIQRKNYLQNYEIT